VGNLQVVAAQATTQLQGVGREGTDLRYSIAAAILSVTGFAIGIRWGLVGVAAGYAIANTLLIPFYLAIGGRAVGVSLREFGDALAGVVQAAAGMAIVVLGLRIGLLHQLSAGPRLVLLIAAGCAVYFPLCLWRAPEIVEDVRRVRTSRAKASEVAGPLQRA
jgi:lipopolysaccharide exporter